MPFSAAHVECFKVIKRRLCGAPQLAYPNLEAPFTLYTDASNIAVGAVFLQRDANGVETRNLLLFENAVAGAKKLLDI